MKGPRLLAESSVAAPSRIVVREIRPTDVDAVAALDASTAGIAHWQREDYVRTAQPASAIQCWVAEADNRIVGFLTARTTLGETEILNIAVAETDRRQGVATKLLQGRLNAIGTRVAFLDVRESNSAARAFYELLGFRETGRRRGYYSNPGEDAIVLRRDLAAGH